ncbi:MAG TPA: hypothetical protein VEU72_01185 [Nitrosopumilaceae archaeon]|nr:hypothetical protein [Nitrosopumilaceae archaeon]
MRMVVRQLNRESKTHMMKKSTQRFIMIAVILVLANSGIYFVTAYSQMKESGDAGSQIQTMLFTTAAITYLPLGIWMIKNRLHSRAPYVIASLISVALVGLYVTSRTINLPLVGIQNDIGMIDVLAKITQGAIVVVSLLLLRKWKKEKIAVSQ